ncbi:carboxypeptidase regulatory-like domain-containing protein [Brevundimonas sp.]|uniref:TonB-dependent receptor n=1 Tax=Brevundimonas sp. TaxID=1871086 RepID=UPI0037C1B425
MKVRTIRERLLTGTMVGGVALAALAAMPVVLAPTTALAQSQTGGLRIAVTGSAGQPIAGATVVVSSPSSLVSRTAVTDADGRVRVSGLDPATNYTVSIDAPEYSNFSAGNVAIVSGRDLSVGYSLADRSGATDLGDIVVTGTSLAAIDTTSATVSTTLTLETMEALPTGRSYQSYLQLVPGTKPGNNPSSRSGVNYSDIGGAVGSSTDNLYYLDGVDVTDPVSGTFGANFNSEIIQEQQVLVGAIPAEYAGGSGLISRVVTKSGSNEWHGSANYYFQNDSLVQEDYHNNSGGFSTYDAAVTLGGPILKDRLWVFGSYQKRNREDEVLDPNTGEARRNVEQDSEYSFGKVTWQVNDENRLSATFFNDPYETTGSSSATVLNNRDTRRVQGGNNYKIDYTGVFDDLTVNAYWFRHEGEISDYAADTSVTENVIYASAAASTLAQRSLGGFGGDTIRNRDRDEYGINAEYFLNTGFGTHTFKAGYVFTENSTMIDSSVPNPDRYTSLAAQYSGTNFATVVSGGPGWTARPIVAGDMTRLIDGITSNATALAAVDTDGDGEVTTAEVNALTFTNTADSPYGNVALYRMNRVATGAYEVKSEGQSVYLQDTWTLNQLTVNAGVRAEKWTHFDSNGEEVANFDWEIAPRLSVVYDLFGDGRSKVFGYAGRYYDPIRNNMTDFAGGLTGPVDEEQINVAGEWVTFRTRGGASTPDALFSPTTKTPYTDEFLIGYSTTFRSDIGFTATVTRRQTRDIMEDFDLALYSDPTCTAEDCGAYGYAFPGSAYYLPYSYFGYDSAPNSNYVIGTLPGGERNYTGLELTLTKYKTDNWFGQISYTYNDADGNTNSDSNADYQGDLIFLDPRAPNASGNQPGNIEHQFKAYGGYEFDWGLVLAGVFNWNSGYLYTPAQPVGGRYFAPTFDDPALNACGDPADPSPGYYNGGVCDTWYLPGYIGSETAPSYWTFDIKATYTVDMPFGKTELFLDIFNLFNKQSATGVESRLAGSGVYDYQEANSWVSPRRANLGVRYSF